MNEIDSTIHGIVKLKQIVGKFNEEFDSNIKTFLKKFNNDGDEADHEDNAISLELKETFFRLMEAKEFIDTVDSLLTASQQSLSYTKKNSEIYKSASIFVKKNNVHDFLIENIEIGDEGEWSLVFDFSHDLPSSVFQLNGILYHEINLCDIIIANYPNALIDITGEFFPKCGWEEQNIKMIKTNEDKLITVID